MQRNKAIELLETAIREPSKIHQIIPQFQQLIWKEPAAQSGYGEILRDLAYDLDFFESDPSKRKEDPCFLDREGAITEIKSALIKIKIYSGASEKH